MTMLASKSATEIRVIVVEQCRLLKTKIKRLSHIAYEVVDRWDMEL